MFAPLFIMGAYRALWRRRWQRGKCMENPIRAYLVVWASCSAIWWAEIWATGDRSHATALVYVAGMILTGIVSAVAAAVIWALGMGIAEAITWFTTPDSRLQVPRPGHWVTLEECAANKQALEQGLVAYAPNVDISALLASMANTGWMLGADLAVLYTRFAEPWLAWHRAEQTLLSGGRWWHEDPAESAGAEIARVAGPYIGIGVRVSTLALYVAFFMVCPPDGRAVVALAGVVFALLAAYRHPVRARLLARQR